MDSELSRRINISLQLKGLSINHQFVNAVIGKDIDSVHLSRLAKNSLFNIKRELTAGEIGCYFSHVKAIKMFLASDDNFAVITEDDVKFLSGFEGVILDIIMNISNDVDVLLLGYRNGYGSFWKGISISEHDCIRFVDCGYGAHAYLLSRSGAEKILSFASQPSWPYDYVTGGVAIPSLKVYGLKDKIVNLDELTSNLSSLERERNNLGSLSTRYCESTEVSRFTKLKWFIKRLFPIKSYPNET